jgi:hypothetical protein
LTYHARQAMYHRQTTGAQRYTPGAHAHAVWASCASGVLRCGPRTSSAAPLAAVGAVAAHLDPLNCDGAATTHVGEMPQATKILSQVTAVAANVERRRGARANSQPLVERARGRHVRASADAHHIPHAMPVSLCGVNRAGVGAGGRRRAQRWWAPKVGGAAPLASTGAYNAPGAAAAGDLRRHLPLNLVLVRVLRMQPRARRGSTRRACRRGAGVERHGASSAPAAPARATRTLTVAAHVRCR